MLLSRNRTDGQLTDLQVPPTEDKVIVLGGGFFQPFVKDPDPVPDPNPNPAPVVIGPVFELADDAGTIDLQYPGESQCTTDIARRAGCRCPVDARPPATEKYWTTTKGLERLGELKINLVRVFAMNGTAYKRPNDGILDVYPFIRDKATSKLLVQDAVERNAFNRAYFDTYLRPFVDKANTEGVAVQLCLFSFHDFTNDVSPYFKYYEDAPWNPTATLPEAWGEQNLIPASVGTNAVARNMYFTNVNNAGLMKVQEWWIGCVLQTLRGRGNVILELFNEPRSVGTVNAKKQLAAWYDRMVTYMTRFFFSSGWRPLISVNPVYDDALGEFDIDTWKREYPQTFAEVDIISHHGLTGWPTVNSSPCGATGKFAPVTPKHISDRITAHKNAYGDKALFFSTDAVKNLAHEFADSEETRPGNVLELLKRDGQIRTSLSDDSPAQEFVLVAESDLENWAFWSYREMIKDGNKGKVHFQNHSIYEPSFELIAAARVKAMAASVLMQPAYAPPDWSPYSHLSDPKLSRNFSWAQRHLTAEGGSVTQLGTVAAQQDPRWEMTVETGWRCNFTVPANGWYVFHVAYKPVSVSIRSQGAVVLPFVIARLSEVGAGGALLPAFARNHIALAPGATPGTLSVFGDVVAGKRYAIVFAGGVTVDYRNRYQGYGEVIVHFPSVRKAVL